VSVLALAEPIVRVAAMICVSSVGRRYPCRAPAQGLWGRGVCCCVGVSVIDGEREAEHAEAEGK
jgi:hypothetical protein